MKKSLFFAAALLSLAACTRNQEIDIPDADMVLTARTESSADTRTVVESGVHVFWEPGDEIAVFSGERSGKFTTDLTAASGTATFKGTLGEETWTEGMDLWAVYPYSEEAVFDGETITTVLPSEQLAREGSFGKDVNLTVAHSNSASLQFYNVGGGIRFSVTEEGIKKVIFEGLSGEIISGKVKIGFDGNGIPVVKEVSGGSQFITLLPPTGKETFEPGVWYYIVAIPGSLEGGYKLRFYKDSDYARKVSEKAVEIKRSIFGNIEKADDGIEYEATVTHFPETREEIVSSVRVSQTIYESILSIVEQLEQENRTSLNLLAEELKKQENVLNVYVNSVGSGIIIQQKDSVFFNFYPTSLDEQLDDMQNGTQLLQEPRLKVMRNTDFDSPKKRALLLYPAENFDNYVPDFKDNVCNALDYGNLDYSDSKFEHDKADVLLFLGDYLDDFDFIHIGAHGNVGGAARMADGVYKENNEVFGFITGTPFSEETAVKLIDEKKLSWDKVFYCMFTDEKRFCMIPDFLDDASFNNTCVITTSCSSAQENTGYYMLQRFLSKNAAAYSGYTNTISVYVGPFIDQRVISFLCHGISFQDAAEYWKNNVSTITYSESYQSYYRQRWIGKGFGQTLRRWVYGRDMDRDVAKCDYRLFKYEMHPSYLDKPFFLVESQKIVLQQPKPTEAGNLLFNWECNLEDFSITDSFNRYYSDTWETYEPYEMIHEYTVHYDVYIDGSRLGKTLFTDDTDKKAFWAPSSVGKHSWYVVAKIMEGNNVIASYPSDSMDFYVTEEQSYETPEAKDLGLSVKWASFNLGASKPEEYGDYYAWGETEPYYNSLNPLTWKGGKENGFDWASYKWCSGTDETMSKYCFDSSYGYNGFADGKTILDAEDDAASVNLGDDWRMPTDAEMTELRESCTWKWTTRDGVNGYDVTGPNGNSIFLPASGACDGNTGVSTAGSRGFYWTSSLHTDSTISSYGITFWSAGIGRNGYARCLGMTIRPVYGEKKTSSTGDIEGTEDDPWN